MKHPFFPPVLAALLLSASVVHTQQASQQAPKVVITKVLPSITMVDAQGRTAEPIRVKYDVLSGASDATGAIYLERTEFRTVWNVTHLITVPLPGLREGSYEVELPAGIALDLPSRDLNVEVKLPPGATGEPFMTTIRNLRTATAPEDGNAAEFEPKPKFDALKPEVVGEGAPPTRVTIDGTAFRWLTHVHVRRAEDDWTALKVEARTATSVTFELPRELTAKPGFLLVAPERNESRGIPLMVAAPNLPAPMTDETAYIQGVGDDDVITPGRETVRIIGTGFARGAKIVFGLGERPGVVLATEFVSATVLKATLPPFMGEANNLVAAVLTRNGRALSTLYPLRSHYPDSSDSLIELVQNREVAGEPVNPEVWTVEGTLHWNAYNEHLEIEGIKLTSGLEVTFTAVTHDAPMTNAARAQSRVRSVTVASVNPPSRKELTRVAVAVPRELTAHPHFTIGVTIQQPDRAARQGAPDAASETGALNVPFGGHGHTKEDVADLKEAAREVLQICREKAVPTDGPNFRRLNDLARIINHGELGIVAVVELAESNAAEAACALDFLVELEDARAVLVVREILNRRRIPYDLRIAAIYAAAKLQDTAVAGKIVDIFKSIEIVGNTRDNFKTDEDEEIFRAAARALGRLPDERGRNVLKAALADPRYPEYQRSIIIAATRATTP